MTFHGRHLRRRHRRARRLQHYYKIEITTNRVDAMNHYGVAREVSAIYDLDLAALAPKVSESGPANFSITIEDA